MPRIVDHDQRRAQIARAFQQHVAEHGFAATTYTRVAAAAGISVGTIQHYFSDRQELLEYAFDDLIRRRDMRVDARVVAGEKGQQSIRDILDGALGELLPLDADRRREHRMEQQLRVEAAHDPALAKLSTAAHEALHRRVRTAVRNGTECGEVALGTDPHIAATRILSTALGLADILAMSNDWADDFPDRHHEVLNPVVATVFTGACRRHGISG